MNGLIVLLRVPSIAEMCNYLLVYEYVIDAEYEQDVWRGVKRSVATQSLKETRGAPIKKSNRTLLLGGRKDGCICVLNWESGEVDFLIEVNNTFLFQTIFLYSIVHSKTLFT